MVAGGGEELRPTESAAVFDTLFATSLKRHTRKVPSPYDSERDGLCYRWRRRYTCSWRVWTCCCSWCKRSYAEIIGFASNCDAAHVDPTSDGNHANLYGKALKDAQLPAEKIGYVSAHGTATEKQILAESNATANIFGEVPISSLKSYFGHTLGRMWCDWSLVVCRWWYSGWFSPTLNLENIDEQCASSITSQVQVMNWMLEYLMSNNFAFGGINTSIIFKKSRIENENWLAVAVVVLLAGCSAPKYSGNALPDANNIKNITIVEDVKTRSIFLDSMLNWCLKIIRSNVKSLRTVQNNLWRYYARLCLSLELDFRTLSCRR